MSNANPELKQKLSATLINDLVAEYPDMAEILINEYGFHCIGCFASQFETLEEGAMVHGIGGEDYEELLNYLISKVVEAK